MNAEDLQQYLFKKANEIRQRGTLNGNQDPEYLRALKDVVEDLTEERELLIKSYEYLKKLKLVI